MWPRRGVRRTWLEGLRLGLTPLRPHLQHDVVMDSYYSKRSQAPEFVRYRACATTQPSLALSTAKSIDLRINKRTVECRLLKPPTIINFTWWRKASFAREWKARSGGGSTLCSRQNPVAQAVIAIQSSVSFSIPSLPVQPFTQEWMLFR